MSSSAFGYKKSSIVGNVNTINTDISMYSPDELSKILQLQEVTKESITGNTNKYINKFKAEKNHKMEKFMMEARQKLLLSIPKDNDTSLTNSRDTYDNQNDSDEQLNNWFSDQNIIQDKDEGIIHPLGTTDRRQKIDIYDDHHNVMNQEKLAVQHQPEIIQGQINPTLKNTFTRIINVDSKFRLNAVPSTKKQKFRNIINAQSSQWSSTDYTLNFNDSLKKLLNLKLYSLQIPYSWYTVDAAYGTSCFILTQLSDPSEQYITGSSGTAILENINTRNVAVDGFDIVQTLGGSTDLSNNVVNFNSEPIEGVTNNPNMPFYFINDTDDVIDSNGIRIKVKTGKTMKILINSKNQVKTSNGSTDADIRILDINEYPTRFFKSDFSVPVKTGTFLSDNENNLISKLYFTLDKFGNTITYLSNALSTNINDPRVREHSPKIIFDEYKSLLNIDANGNTFTMDINGTVKYNAENTGIDFDGNIILNENETFKNFKTIHSVIVENGNYTPQQLVTKVNSSLKEDLESTLIRTTEISFFDDKLSSMIFQTQDRKILVGGTFFDGTHKKMAITRYTTNGTLDTTFNSSGIQTISADINNDELNSIAYRALDQKIIYGGTSFNEVTGRKDFVVGRLNSNGSIDTTFGPRKTGVTTLSFDDGDDIITKIVLQNADYLGDQTQPAIIYACGYSYNTLTKKYDFAVAGITNATTSDGDLYLQFNSTGKRRYQVGNDDDILTDALISEVNNLIVSGYSYDTTDKCYKFAIGKILIGDANVGEQPGDTSPAFQGDGFVTTHIFDDKTDSFATSLINMKFYRGTVIPNGLSTNITGYVTNSDPFIYPTSTKIATKYVGISSTTTVDPQLRTLKEGTFINNNASMNYWQESIAQGTSSSGTGSDVEIVRFTINSGGELSELILKSTSANLSTGKLGGSDFYPGNKIQFSVGSTAYEYVVIQNDIGQTDNGLKTTTYKVLLPEYEEKVVVIKPTTPSSPTSGTALSQNTYFVSKFMFNTFPTDNNSTLVATSPKVKELSLDRMGNVIYPIQMANSYQGSGLTSTENLWRYEISVLPRLWDITESNVYVTYGTKLNYIIQSDDLNSAGTGVDGDANTNLSNWGYMPLLNVEKNSQINVGSNNSITEFKLNGSGQLIKFVLLNVGGGYYAGNILSIVYYDILYKYTITSQDLVGDSDNSSLDKTVFDLLLSPINPEFLFLGSASNSDQKNKTILTSTISQGTRTSTGSGTSVNSILTYDDGKLREIAMTSGGTGFYAGNIIEVLYYETKYTYTITLNDLENGADNNALKNSKIDFTNATALAPTGTTLTGTYSRANGKIPKIYPNLNNKITVYNSVNGDINPTNTTYYEDNMRLTTTGNGIGAICNELIFSNGYTRVIRLSGGRGYKNNTENVTIVVKGAEFGSILNTNSFLEEDYVVGGYAFNSATETYDFALVFFGHRGEILNSSNGGWGTTGKITFSPIPNYHNFLTSLDITLDGKIIAGGYAYNGSNYVFVTIRILIDGSLDTTFGTEGILRTEISNSDLYLKSLIANVDGKITAAGSLNKNSNSDFALTRYTINGNIDTTFVNKENEKTYATAAYNSNTGKATMNMFNKYQSILFYKQNEPFCSPKCGVGPKANSSLGWLLGFRDQEYASRDFTTNVNSVFSFVGEATVDTFGPRYFLLSIDDFHANQINKAIISGENVEKKADIPSYFTSDLTPNPQCDTSNKLYEIPQYLQGRPRQITQAQQYTLNEILKNRKESSNDVLTSPTSSDIFAIIPLKKNGMGSGEALIEFSGPIQINERNYFGPIDVDKLRIKLIDDKGNVVNLNGMDWSFSLITEHLYQY